MDDRLIARLRNRLRTAAAGAPAGELSPLVPNDLYRAHESLFTFLTAFSPGKRVLLLNAMSGFPAAMAQARGAATVTAVLPSEKGVRFAEKSWPSPAVKFTTSTSRTFDLVIARSDSTGVGRTLAFAEGNVLLHVAPHVVKAAEWERSEEVLRSRFASVRRFAHRALAPLDLASPLPSTVTPFDFSFEEILPGEDLPADLLTIVYFATNDPRWAPAEFRLHLGCGPVALPGWINVDNQPYAGIDLVWDLAMGIPFRSARYIFAEHFIEHLSLDQGASFLDRCRKALQEDGTLRLSTPNLDWVWSTSYHPGQWPGDREAVWDCIALNRAFRGWGHQFLYNRQMLTAALRQAGFAEAKPCRYGESEDPLLRGIEHHEQYHDVPELPHVLVFEASGRAEPETPFEELRAEYRRDVNVV